MYCILYNESGKDSANILLNYAQLLFEQGRIVLLGA
jgi:hypothetical protein